MIDATTDEIKESDEAVLEEDQIVIEKVDLDIIVDLAKPTVNVC